jgi:hypothetical protein
VPKPPPLDRAELTEDESAVIAAFFRRHVASPFLHAVSHLTSLLRLLTLPLPVLQEFVQLMRRENERPTGQEGMGLRYARCVPPLIPHALSVALTHCCGLDARTHRWLLSTPALFSAASAGQPGVVHDRATGALSFVVGPLAHSQRRLRVMLTRGGG